MMKSALTIAEQNCSGGAVECTFKIKRNCKEGMYHEQNK